VTEGSTRSVTSRLGEVAARAAGDPERVGRYQVLGRLGSGGMGTVYLARLAGPAGNGRPGGGDPAGSGSGGGPVALKVVHPELAADPEFRARFRDEVAAARRVAPFCTARVLDADPDANPPYLVTEYVDGLPLGRIVADRGALGDSTVHGLALGVAAALTAIHGAGLVHRDLKPANVLLSLSGPRVIDFGIAHALDSTARRTMAGTVLGTPGWMAPEQFSGGAPGAAADVFSWGSLVAYAGTGRQPWGEEGPPAAFAYRIIHGEPDLGGLDGLVRPLVEAALGKDPARRPAARDLVLALLGGDPPTDPSAVATAAATAAATHLLDGGWARAAAGPAPMPMAHPQPSRPYPQPSRPYPQPSQPYPKARQPYSPAARPQPGGSRSYPPGPRVAGPAPAGRTVAVPPPTRAYGPTHAPPPQRAGSTRPAQPRATQPPPVVRPARPPSQPAGAPPRRRGRGRDIGGPPPWRPYDQRVVAARPRRRRWYRKKRYLLPVGLLVLLAAAASNRDNGRSPSAGGQRGQSGRGAGAPAGLGAPVRDGQLEFVVQSWRCGVDKLSRGPLSRRPHGQFCLATLEARNIGGQPRTLVEWIEKVHDTAGHTYAAGVRGRQ
jgi:serine/threonine protein kinase